MKKIIKIDNINSVEEASELQSFNADILGVSLVDTPRNTDIRVIDDTTLIEISKVLIKSKLSVELEINSKTFEKLRLLEKIELDYIQISNNKNFPIEIKKYLQERNIGIIYSEIGASFDDDPSWIINNLEDNEMVNNAIFQIDLLGDMECSWEFFKTQCPNFNEDLQISDIDIIGMKYPILISLDFSSKNILEIIKKIPSIKGISMRITKNKKKNFLHYFDYESILEILETLKKHQSV